MREYFPSEYSVSFFTKVVVAKYSSMGTVFILEEHLKPCLVDIKCIWQIFLFKAYSLKQALANISSFQGIELIWHSIFSHHSNLLWFFLQKELYQEDIIFISYDTS